MRLLRETPLVLISIAFLSVVTGDFAFAGGASSSSKGHRAGYSNQGDFAAPGSTTRQLDEDDQEKEPALRVVVIDQSLQPWFDFKKRLNEGTGLQLGLAYTTTYQKADETLPGNEDGAFSGLLRLSGKWVLLDRGGNNSGSLVFSVDNREKYHDVAPANLANEIGYIGPTALLFGDQHTVLVDFNWQQFLNDGNTGILVGRYDPNDYMHVLGYANPWTTFQNLNILLDSSVAYPDAGVGAGIGHRLNHQWYFKAGFNDANGKVTEERAFQHGAEFFKFVEIGWSPSHEQRYLSNAHLTVWDVDERDHDAIGDAQGIALGANWTWDETVMVFGKAGFSDADEPNDPQIYEKSYTLGALYYFDHRSDLAGIAVNWGELAASGLGEQTTTELFYRIQLAKNLAITPNMQILNNPALNDQDGSITTMGLRVRFTL